MLLVVSSGARICFENKMESAWVLAVVEASVFEGKKCRLVLVAKECYVRVFLFSEFAMAYPSHYGMVSFVLYF